MMPLQPITVLVANLRPLSIDNISILTSIKMNLDLQLIKSIILRLESILQTFHIALWVQDLPGLYARLAST